MRARHGCLQISYSWRALAIAVLILFANVRGTAQPEISIGTWRLHLSYNSIHSITSGNNQIFGASKSGIIIFDLVDQRIDTYNTITGLSSTGITSLGFDEQRKQLVVAYEDGNIDIISTEGVTNFSRIKTTTGISGSRRVNHITIRNGLAYFSADFGIVVFDLERKELKETWRNLGPAGSAVRIFKTTFAGDSIFAATSNGIIAGNMSDNLLDFSFWNRFNTGELEGTIASVENFQDRIFAAIDDVGFFEKSGNQWINRPALEGIDFNSLTSTGNTLLITTTEGVWSLDLSNALTRLSAEVIASPVDALADINGHLWIADVENGLVSNALGTFKSYLPNGPGTENVFRLEAIGNKLYAIPGGFDGNAQPFNRRGTLSYFENGAWTTVQKELTDLTDVSLQDGSLFTASFNNGLERFSENVSTVYNQNNSPLTSIDGQRVAVSAIESSADGLWILNYGTTQPLHLLRGDNWQSFTLPSQHATDMTTDLNGNVWMILEHGHSGGLQIFDRNNNSASLKTTTTGNGALPDMKVFDIDVDRYGRIWIGTENGVAYFLNDDSDAIRPIFENRFLLQSEKITAIETDGGNRKWIASGTGVWLFNPEGDELVASFNTENSPLLSNNVLDIEINDTTGEVFFATEKGIVSYRSDATESQSVFSRIKIFPNPVTPAFSGLVGIEGLATDAVVKITDISGKLIWQTRANGGTATWNVRDYNGKRAATGIYIVYAATENGSDSIVGKIAVVD